MLFGMGTVFVFLTVLVFATNFMSTVVNKLNTDDLDDSQSPASHAAPAASTGTNPGQPSAQVISAIEKAIATHRASK